jgi:nucleoside-diphosphate-sugar epimerase
MPTDGLTVTVTGPTGDLGVAIMDALERARSVKKIVGMARSPFDPADAGWKKTEYRQGDVQDPASVSDAVKGSDVVVHLAFAILSASDDTRAVNVEGSRIVFEETAKAGAERLCYASSVAAYGFHEDNPDWLTEDVPARGTPEHFYSAQKAEVEEVLMEVLAHRTKTQAYVFRPCIVAGPRAQTLLDELPYVRLSDAMPDAVIGLLRSLPMLRPVIPDPGTRFQLVHEDDVASAFALGVRGQGPAGAYNLAGGGTLRTSDLADALGWYSIGIPELAVDATAEVISRIPGAPAQLSWIHSVRKEVLMKTDRARKELKWKPKHTGRATLKALVQAHRQDERIAHSR